MAGTTFWRLAIREAFKTMTESVADRGEIQSGSDASLLRALLARQIVVMDGAMGTLLLSRGNLAPDVDGRLPPPDLLNIGHPAVVSSIHAEYLGAGADLLRTNTFNANPLVPAMTGRRTSVAEINRAGAALARAAADEAMAADPARPRFVAGVLGPAPPVSDPGALAEAYGGMAAALLNGGADLLLMETITSVDVAAAAVSGLLELFAARGRAWPVMVSATLARELDHLPAGRTVDHLWPAVRDAGPIAVGLNCGFGAAHLGSRMERLSAVLPAPLALFPNAGLPDAKGMYGDSPADMAAILGQVVRDGYVNMVGGCCGTTPDHIRAIAMAVKDMEPRQMAP